MKYKTVVIDFPWPVEAISDRAAALMGGTPLKSGLPYKTMTLEQIRAFPINDFADEQCALFMWTTQGFLEEAYSIVKQWGFKSSRLITWEKKSGINLLGFRINSEFAIFAYRGRYPIVVKRGLLLPTVLHSRRTKHSEKPAEFYEKIRPLTFEPRIDIFARRRHYGFDAWGDQVEGELVTLEQYNN